MSSGARWCGGPFLCVLVSACGASDTSSTLPTTPTSSAIAEHATAPTAPGPTAPGSSDLIYSVTGPMGCASLTTPSRWLLDVASAGPGFHLVLAAFTDGHANCEETRDHPATHFTIDGPLDYAADGKGQTVFSYPAETCGRVQVDLGLMTADGKERLIVGTVLNSGKECDPPPPPTPTCANTPALCPPSPPPCEHPKEHHCPGPKTCHSGACAKNHCHGH